MFCRLFVGSWALEGPLFCEVRFNLFEVHDSDVLTYSVTLLSHESDGVKAPLY